LPPSASVVHRVAGPGPIGTWGPPPAPTSGARFCAACSAGRGPKWWWAWAQSASHASCCSGSIYMYAHGLTMDIYIYIYMRAKKNRAPNKSRIREHKARGCNQRVVWVRERSATGAGKDLPAPAQMCALRKNKPPRRKTRENRAGGCHQCVVDYAWGFHWSATHRLLFAARGRSHPAPRGAT
jgi:hypothetical protein